MGQGNRLCLPRRNPAKSAASTRFMAIGTLTGVASFLSMTMLPRNAPTGRPVCAPARRYGHRSSGKAIGELESGFVLSLRQHAIKPLLASDSLLVVGILDRDPGKGIRAGLRFADDSFQILLAHQLEEPRSVAF